ncbi:ketoacyl-synthetase C-terminal extension domain-containing protein, partial [Methylogaea oryzae]
MVTRGEPWHSPQGAPLRAGISSFGAGGANAHVILEAGDAPADEVAA